MKRSIVTKLVLVGLLTCSTAAFGNVVHVLAFRYKPGVTEAQRADFARRILALRTTAKRNGRPYIVSIRGGRAISHEGFDRDLEQLFLVEFRTINDRNFFVGPPYIRNMDPVHRAAADVIEPNVERSASGKPSGLFVFDFEDRETAKRR
jgi:Stress responsive A/B Barrel Domain